MSEPQQQYGKRWDELSPDEQKGGYWLAIPDDPDDVMDQMEYEVVLVTYNGQRIVYRPGMQFPVLCGTLRFLYRLDLPETAAEAEERARLYGRVMSEPNRQLEAAAERMRQADSCGPDWSCLLYHDAVDRRMVDDVAMIVRAYLALTPPDNGPTWEGLVDAAARSTAQREALTAAELSGNSGQLTSPEELT